MDTPIPEKLADAATEGRGKGLYILSLVHSGSGLQSGAAQRLGEDAHAVFSPDAKWLAYDTVVQGTPGMQVRAMNGPGQWSLGPGCFSAWAPGRRRIYRCQAVEQTHKLQQYRDSIHCAEVLFKATGDCILGCHETTDLSPSLLWSGGYRASRIETGDGAPKNSLNGG